MAKFFDEINENIQQFIAAQHMFFVASAPLNAEGHINLSPKGLDCFRMLSANRVAYLDFIGSGNETSAHLYENGRITFMFCAFDGPPNIVRLFGTGRTVRPTDTEWGDLFALFPHDFNNVRQIFVVDVEKAQTSCGYGVPFMDYVGERDTMARWADQKGQDGLIQYQCEYNVTSMDGLPTPLGVDLVSGIEPISLVGSGAD
ncbi:MAG: pyridoxamine 5'-phosphate oxidase family protein [Burkholderiales bacterium]|nr:pyridoxamine 5'-phosphate oxidase family protein [Anaerolineae bacterium]